MEFVEEICKDKTVHRYQKGKFLGKGGFAKCYELSDETSAFAAKVIGKATLVKSRARQKLMSEIKIHRALVHSNIVRFHHYFEDSENVYILLELCTNQTMNELLRRRKRLTELEVQCYLMQILVAIKYLHKHRVIHRDLKLGNLFLSERMEIKLGDFGLATQLEFEGERKRTVCGTPNYIAPEILESRNGHSYEVDVWSFGVIAYTLLIGKPPFETSDVKSTYRRIKMNAYSFPETVTISQAAKQLIQKILVTDPSKRPTVDEIIGHEFFAGGIPQLLPVSTLACPPSSTFMRQYNKSTSQHKVDPKYSSQVDLKVKAQTMYKSMDRLPARPAETAMTQTIGSGLTQMIGFTQTMGSTNAGQFPEASVTVKKWVDYSSKYGLGYLLSTNQCGVFFNDCTKIVLLSDNNFVYIERNGEEQYADCERYPEQLTKKVTLLMHFKGYLAVNEQPEQLTRVYVKKWMKAKHAIIFRLSDKTVQVVFNDNTQMILTQQLKVVTYVDKEKNKQTQLLSLALESENAAMVKRLKYTKEVLSQMLGQKKEGSLQPLQDRANTINVLSNNFCSTSRLKSSLHK